MRICLVHEHRLTREVLAQILAAKLNAEVIEFSCLEDLFVSSMNFNVFVLYSIFGRQKMDRHEGLKWIRSQRPEALIVSMIHKSFFERKHSPPGTDAAHVQAGKEVEGIVKLIKQSQPGKSYVFASGDDDDKDKDKE